MAGISHVAWPQLAEFAATAPNRPAIVRARAADFEPCFGDLSDSHARRLVAAARDMLALRPGFIAPMHSAKPEYLPTMLEEGFRWPRWRADDGFEPYSVQLRTVAAMGADERIEDILFAGVQFVPGRGSLVEALDQRAANAVARGRAIGLPYYGSATLTFDPARLADATILPTATITNVGLRSGTIEHLPEIVAMRVAIDGAALLQHKTRQLQEVLDYVHPAPKAHAKRAALQLGELQEVLDDRDPRTRTGFVQRAFDKLSAPGSAAPIETHLRDITPADPVHVALDAPSFLGMARQRGRVVTSTPRTAAEVLAGIADGSLDTAQITSTHPAVATAIHRAATARGVPVFGLVEHHDAARAASQLASMSLPDFRWRTGPEHPGPTTSTAERNLDTRRAMARWLDAADPFAS